MSKYKNKYRTLHTSHVDLAVLPKDTDTTITLKDEPSADIVWLMIQYGNNNFASEMVVGLSYAHLEHLEHDISDFLQTRKLEKS